MQIEIDQATYAQKTKEWSAVLSKAEKFDELLPILKEVNISLVNEEYLEAHKKLIRALSKAYGNDLF